MGVTVQEEHDGLEEDRSDPEGRGARPPGRCSQSSRRAPRSCGGIKNMPRTVGWSTFIRQIILSDDVNIIHRSKHFDWQEDGEPDVKWTDIDVVSHKRNSSLKMLGIEVYFHDRLSSEIKDEICSKLASALRALKSRISRICGINELERRG